MGYKFQDSTANYQTAWTSSTPQNTVLSTYAWGYSTAIITVQNTGTISGGVISFEGFDGTNWYGLSASQLSNGTNSTTYSLSGGSAALGSDITGFSQFRVKLSTAITGTGSVLVTINESGAALSSLVSSSSSGGGSTTNANLYSGQQTVNTTAVQVTSSSNSLTNGVIIKALTTNAAIIYVGSSSVTTSNGDALEPGESRGYGVSNTNIPYIISVASTTDKVTWSAN